MRRPSLSALLPRLFLRDDSASSYLHLPLELYRAVHSYLDRQSNLEPNFVLAPLDDVQCSQQPLVS